MAQLAGVFDQRGLAGPGVGLALPDAVGHDVWRRAEADDQHAVGADSVDHSSKFALILGGRRDQKGLAADLAL